MENSTISRSTVSFGLSLAACAVLNALLVIAKERSKTVSGWMQNMSGHHWVTHVGIVLIVFVMLGWLLGRTAPSQRPSLSASRLANIIVAAAASSVAIIVGYYLIAG